MSVMMRCPAETEVKMLEMAGHRNIVILHEAMLMCKI